jgi:predicted nucleic acid-binding protein
VALVLDTDVVSYLYKRDTRAELYQPHLNDPPFIISFMSLAELRRWTLERNWGERRRQELEEYLSRYFVIHSED